MKLLYLGLFAVILCAGFDHNSEPQKEIKYSYRVDLDGDSIHIQDKYGKNTTVHANKLLNHITKDNL